MSGRQDSRTEHVFVWFPRSDMLRLIRWARRTSVLATARSRALARRVALPRVDSPLVREFSRLEEIVTRSWGGEICSLAFRAKLDAALRVLEAQIAAPPRYREPVPRDRRADRRPSRLVTARSRGLKVRLRPDEKEWLLAVCADHNLTPGRAFRLLAMGRTLPMPYVEDRMGFWLERAADAMFPVDMARSYRPENDALRDRLNKAWEAFTRVGPIRHHKNYGGMDELMDYLEDSRKGRRRFL